MFRRVLHNLKGTWPDEFERIPFIKTKSFYPVSDLRTLTFESIIAKSKSPSG